MVNSYEIVSLLQKGISIPSLQLQPYQFHNFELISPKYDVDGKFFKLLANGLQNI